MSTHDTTFVGHVASATGGIVRVRLRHDAIGGSSSDASVPRGSQVGEFFRVPLPHLDLYAVCTQFGADAAPQHLLLQSESFDLLDANRWMTIVLFGEGTEGVFERGVGQYPTVGDEVHRITSHDLQIIYGAAQVGDSVSVGMVAAAGNVPARIRVAPLVSRHSAVIGSTGSGKSNLATILLEELSSGEFPAARVLVIDSHGEYPGALGERARSLRINPDKAKGEHQLVVPFWTLPFDDLREIAFGELEPGVEAIIRDMVLDAKRKAAAQLDSPTPFEAISADSPIPFSLKKLWFDLDDFERQTFREKNNQTDKTIYPLDAKGDPERLRPNRHRPPGTYNEPPFENEKRRHIGRQLEHLAERLKDVRFRFLFDPPDGYAPDVEGRVEADLDSLIAEWIGHDKSATVLDVSGLPEEVSSIVVGTVLRLIYDALFWAAELPIGGRQRPLLLVLEEAHRFLPEDADTSAHRIFATVAKEGRKYGVGLMLITQRPTEIDPTVLSQCGTMLALRMTNTADRSRVTAAFPDDLEGLTELLPTLRTGEALFVGDAMPVPSRVRIRRAERRIVGDDPQLPEAWLTPAPPDPSSYKKAVVNWRARTVLKDDELAGT
jgi:DNA helicase HerA-like ATPase